PSTIGSSRLPQGFKIDSSYTQAGFNVNWQIDLFGRIRRLTEAARAQFFASEEARHGVIDTLISDVMTQYIALRELDLELEIARKPRDIAKNSVSLTTLRKNRGAATGLDVHQAEVFLYTATSQIAAIEREIAQAEDGLNLLLGNYPNGIPRGKSLA